MWLIALLTTLFDLLLLSAIAMELMASVLPDTPRTRFLKWLISLIPPALAALAWWQWHDAFLYAVTLVTSLLTAWTAWAAFKGLRTRRPGDGSVNTVRFFGAVILPPLSLLLLLVGATGLGLTRYLFSG